MIDFANIFLLVLHIASIVILVLFLPFAIYGHIYGVEELKKILKKFKIPLNYNQILTIWFFSTAIMIITRILRAMLLGKI